MKTNQMKRLILITTLSLIAMLTGCTSTEFTPYAGAQQNWPISSGAFVSNKYVLPVYQGPPPRPYIVLGYIEAATSAGTGDYGLTRLMPRRAVRKQLKGMRLSSRATGENMQGHIQLAARLPQATTAGTLREQRLAQTLSELLAVRVTPQRAVGA